MGKTGRVIDLTVPGAENGAMKGLWGMQTGTGMASAALLTCLSALVAMAACGWEQVSPAVPRQAFLPIWRQLVLPVHLLFLAPLLCGVGSVAGDVKLEDDGVVHHPVDGRGGGHGVGKDALPLGEDQV